MKIHYLKRLTLSFILAATAGGLSLPKEAHAGSTVGFLCDVVWNGFTGDPSSGKFGSMAIQLYSQPYCQGSFVSSAVVLSTGQNRDSNATSYSELGLSTMVQALQTQMIYGLRVILITTSNGGVTAVDLQDRYQ